MKLNNSKFIIHNLTLLLFLPLLLFTSCDTTNPPSNNKITLTFEDASCTEAWLNLKLENISLPTDIKIKQNDSTFLSTNINSNDTTLFIENLLPSQNYTFYSTIKQLNNEAINSNKATVTTMDTTSHNFTWQTFTLGGVNGSSYLKDVAIINENNIWAVGEIHTAETDQWNEDSTKWVQPYNAVHWDGVKWELKRILVNYKGNTIFLALESIFAFSATDIWLVSSLPIHGDGKNWKIYDVREITNSDLSLTTVWGSSSNDIYFAGRSGSLAHYNGSSWTKIESGTELNITDIWGDYNEKTGKWEILAVASDFMENTGRKILKIKNSSVYNINVEPIGGRLHSLWFKPNKKYYIVGSGVYEKNVLEERMWLKLPRDISKYFQESISAQNLNDIIITGHFSEVIHFNGLSWKSYRGKEIPFESGQLFGSDYRNNTTVIVGSNGSEALLYVGKK